MEEVIKEIKEAEEAAAKLVADAEKEAAEILVTLDKEIELLKAEYEEKLRADSAAVLSSAKARINQLHVTEAKNSADKANKIKSDAQGQIKPCADLVYDFIIKEFVK